MRITEIDLTQLNKLADHVEQLRARLSRTESKLAEAHNQLVEVQKQHAFATTNNLLTTWAGGTLTLSWAAGFAKDRKGITYAFPAGSRVLAATTFYWFAWNPIHQVMAVQPSVDGLLQNHNNIIICQVFTGTGAQSGSAGGGGSEPAGNGLSFSRYKSF